MVGIYKITNKINGKSYIGQSIHCGRRLDEHCKGNQLIDQTIQIEGVENFNFEFLKEVNKNELSMWEDYYIMKYNTMIPNGYNLRWNCSKELRDSFIENFSKEEEKKKKINAIKENQKRFNTIEEFYKEYKDITSCQWQLYYYLLDLCLLTPKGYLYKEEVNLSEAARQLKTCKATIYNCLSALKSKKLIEICDNKYYINFKDLLTINSRTLKTLIEYSRIKSVGITPLRVYLLLKERFEINLNKIFSKGSLLKQLNFSKHREMYGKINDSLELLIQNNFIIVEIEEIDNNLEDAGPTVRYILTDIKEI